jgi:hypothetical protein
MSNAAIHAFGTILMMHDGATPGAYASVGQLRSVPIPQMESPRIDVSTHDNSGFTREYINNLSDLPAVEFEIYYLPHDPTHDHLTGLLNLQITGAKRSFKVKYNAAVTPPLVLTFPATVTRFNPSAPVDGPYSAAVQLQPSAAPTYGSS